jgi:hypothetical protein
MNKFLISLAEQVGGTYLFAFLGFLLADAAHLSNLSVVKAAAIAAIPAALAVLKGAIAKFVGNPESANLAE